VTGSLPAGRLPWRQKTGTSKWNKIEHRMFAFITMNWRGRPLTSIRTIIELIAAAATNSGLTIQVAHDPTEYPKGVKTSDAELAPSPSPHTTGTETRTTPSTRHETLKQIRGGPLVVRPTLRSLISPGRRVPDTKLATVPGGSVDAGIHPLIGGNVEVCPIATRSGGLHRAPTG
jgi:hypothetical protein